MTRANILIISGYPSKHYFERGSDGYPTEVMPEIFKLVLAAAHPNHEFKKEIDFFDNVSSVDLAKFIDECSLTLGNVGNPCYYYEVDFKKQTVKAWESTTRWVYAPKNWKERGWVCNETKNGRAGYTNLVKGKKLIDVKFSDMIRMKQTQNGFVPEVNIDCLDKVLPNAIYAL